VCDKRRNPVPRAVAGSLSPTGYGKRAVVRAAEDRPLNNRATVLGMRLDLVASSSVLYVEKTLGLLLRQKARLVHYDFRRQPHR